VWPIDVICSTLSHVHYTWPMAADAKPKHCLWCHLLPSAPKPHFIKSSTRNWLFQLQRLLKGTYSEWETSLRMPIPLTMPSMLSSFWAELKAEGAVHKYSAKNRCYMAKTLMSGPIGMANCSALTRTNRNI
jgi:hypothetical protein